MARIDKLTFSFRAIAGTALHGVMAVKIGTTGQVIYSGTADPVGVICVPGTIVSGRPVSVIRQGEIVEYGGSAGSLVYAVANGSLGYTSGGTKLGFTVEGDRLIVAL